MNRSENDIPPANSDTPLTMSEEDLIPEIVEAEILEPDPHATSTVTKSVQHTPESPNKIPPLPKVCQEVETLCQSHRLGPKLPHQKLVYSLTARTLVEYRGDSIKIVLAIMLSPLIFAFGGLCGGVLAGGLGWAMASIGLGGITVILLGILLIIAGKVFRELAMTGQVRLGESENALSNFKIGRLEEIFEVASPCVYVLFFGFAFGAQIGLLRYLPDHAGLQIGNSLAESFVVTSDNLMHGIFLDAGELYDLHWGKKLNHTTLSATLFFGFRTVFDAFALLIVYSYWKRWTMRGLVRSSPSDPRDLAGILDWISSASQNKRCWVSQYHDEFMFLLLAKAYIEGRFEFVKEVSTALPRLNVEKEVRNLFLDHHGQVVFHGFDTAD